MNDEDWVRLHPRQWLSVGIEAAKSLMKKAKKKKQIASNLQN